MLMQLKKNPGLALRGQTRRLSGVVLLGAAAALAANAQTFTTLVNFDGTNGSYTYYGPLTQGSNGGLYGVAQGGGANNFGTVFEISPSGQLTTLHNFTQTDGSLPVNPPILASNGLFYGTASNGGANNDGTVYKMTPSGTLTTLHSFNSSDGAGPDGGVIQAFDGMLYGTTLDGGAHGKGTIFRITPGGTLTTLHSFSGADGENPAAPLLQASNGLMYGTTARGGSSDRGVIFTISTSGTFAVFYTFDGSQGYEPYGGLIQGNDGNFYGTTAGNGTSSLGTVFQITPAGLLTTLHTFDQTDGRAPWAQLVQGTDGNFYGTTFDGGTHCLPLGCGTIFQITPSGTLTTLHDFDGTDGAYTYCALTQHTDGTFVGTTFNGGSSNFGTVYSLSMGLGPFVKPLPAFGVTGAQIKILGNNLTGASSVTFNGVAAQFKVLSATAISATVPSNATTGTIEVVTTSRTLVSNVAFQVLP